jgi:drug/metabolite transporter (DMT)-like permease
MTRALKHVTATAMGIIHQVTVVLTVLGGLIFFGEMLTLRSAIGSAITVVGVLWVVYSE